MRRGGIFQLVLIGLVAGAIATAVAVLIPWLPAPASREAGRINFVYWFATVISLFIFAVVCAILLYSMINFRVKPGDLSDGPPVHGHTTIEIVWTIIPTILVTAISIVSAIVLHDNSNAGKNPLVVKVLGVQFAWQFQYPNGFVSDTLYLPDVRDGAQKSTYTAVKLEITSNDVIHSFWVPQWAQKQDAVPGQTNSLVITPDKEGTFPVICTELCGLGHSLMRSQAIVESPSAFASWYAKSKQPAPPPSGGGGDDKALATQAFTLGGCIACHTFKAIPGAVGTVGPSLDKLKEDAAKAGEPLADYIKSSITDPDGYITPGYQPGVMPPNLDKSMSSAQFDALVQYLADNTN